MNRYYSKRYPGYEDPYKELDDAVDKAYAVLKKSYGREVDSVIHALGDCYDKYEYHSNEYPRNCQEATNIIKEVCRGYNSSWITVLRVLADEFV